MPGSHCRNPTVTDAGPALVYLYPHADIDHRGMGGSRGYCPDRPRGREGLTGRSELEVPKLPEEGEGEQEKLITKVQIEYTCGLVDEVKAETTPW